MKCTVNTDVKMSRKMLLALGIFEGTCNLRGIRTTTEAEIKDFLRARYGGRLASKFKPEYMYQ